MIHEGTDDLGRMGDCPCLPYIDSQNVINSGGGEDNVISYLDPQRIAASLKTGNAGDRVAMVT